MPSASDYESMFAELLPNGPIWDWIGNGAGTYFDKLISALNIEFGRVDAKASEAINKVIPDDSTATDLESWERICALYPSGTNAERLAAIQAKLRGRGAVDRADLEAVLRVRRGDSNLRLLHHLHAPLLAGGSAAGDEDACGLYQACWTCEYQVERSSAANPDDFGSGWVVTGSGSTLTANQFGSPVTDTAVAAKAHLASGGTAELPFTPGTATDLTARAAVWIRNATAIGPSALQLYFLRRDNTNSSAVNAVSLDGWAKYQISADILTGATQPRFVVKNNSGGVLDLYLARAVVGEVDSTFEAAARTYFPSYTVGEFGVIGENP